MDDAALRAEIHALISVSSVSEYLDGLAKSSAEPMELLLAALHASPLPVRVGDLPLRLLPPGSARATANLDRRFLTPCLRESIEAIRQGRDDQVFTGLARYLLGVWRKTVRCEACEAEGSALEHFTYLRLRGDLDEGAGSLSRLLDGASRAKRFEVERTEGLAGVAGCKDDLHGKLVQTQAIAIAPQVLLVDVEPRDDAQRPRELDSTLQLETCVGTATYQLRAAVYKDSSGGYRTFQLANRLDGAGQRSAREEHFVYNFYPADHEDPRGGVEPIAGAFVLPRGAVEATLFYEALAVPRPGERKPEKRKLEAEEPTEGPTEEPAEEPAARPAERRESSLLLRKTLSGLWDWYEWRNDCASGRGAHATPYDLRLRALPLRAAREAGVDPGYMFSALLPRAEDRLAACGIAPAGLVSHGRPPVAGREHYVERLEALDDFRCGESGATERERFLMRTLKWYGLEYLRRFRERCGVVERAWKLYEETAVKLESHQEALIVEREVIYKGQAEKAVARRAEAERSRTEVHDEAEYADPDDRERLRRLRGLVVGSRNRAAVRKAVRDIAGILDEASSSLGRAERLTVLLDQELWSEVWDEVAKGQKRAEAFQERWLARDGVGLGVELLNVYGEYRGSLEEHESELSSIRKWAEEVQRSEAEIYEELRGFEEDAVFLEAVKRSGFQYTRNRGRLEAMFLRAEAAEERVMALRPILVGGATEDARTMAEDVAIEIGVRGERLPELEDPADPAKSGVRASRLFQFSRKPVKKPKSEARPPSKIDVFASLRDGTTKTPAATVPEERPSFLRKAIEAHARTCSRPPVQCVLKSEVCAAAHAALQLLLGSRRLRWHFGEAWLEKRGLQVLDGEILEGSFGAIEDAFHRAILGSVPFKPRLVVEEPPARARTAEEFLRRCLAEDLRNDDPSRPCALRLLKLHEREEGATARPQLVILHGQGGALAEALGSLARLPWVPPVIVVDVESGARSSLELSQDLRSPRIGGAPYRLVGFVARSEDYSATLSFGASWYQYRSADDARGTSVQVLRHLPGALADPVLLLFDRVDP